MGKWCKSKKHWHLVRLLLSFGLISGCSNEPLIYNYTAPTSSCFTKIEEFQFRRFPLGRDFDFSITPSDATYSFTHGRCEHFAAFSLPDGFSATMIQSKSYLTTDYLPSARALIPDFIFLDEKYQFIKRINVKNLQEQSNLGGVSLTGQVIVPSSTRYIVIVAGYGDGTNRVHSENGTVHNIPPSALGKLSLRLFGESNGAAANK